MSFFCVQWHKDLRTPIAVSFCGQLPHRDRNESGSAWYIVSKRTPILKGALLGSRAT
jgi:hypothetical protein